MPGGRSHWFADCLGMRFARQNVLLLHMGPPKIGSDPDSAQSGPIPARSMLAFSLQLFFSHFSKMCSPPSVGSTFLKNGSKHFAFKNPLFGPLKPSNDDSLAYFFRTYRSLSRSVSHFSASVALQNIAFGCSLVHFSPPEPLLQKCLFASHLKFHFCFASFAFFLYFYALTLLFFALFDNFFEKVFPAFLGKHDFENCM